MRPHTPEWFTATTRHYPDLAESARRNIGEAGHDNVCSICGDVPEGDFKFMSGSLLLRLCRVCRLICAEAYEGIVSKTLRR